MSEIVNIPDLPAATPPELVEFLRSIGDAVSLLQGLGRNLESEKALRVSDLEKLGISIASYLLATKVKPIPAIGIGSASGAPWPPQNLTVTRGPFVHVLQFDIPNDKRINYIQIWVAKNSQIRANAKNTFVFTVKDYGTTTLVRMPVDDVTAEYTYWIRSISFAGDHSIWEPPDEQGGYVVPGDDSIADTIDGIIEILKGGDPDLYNAVTDYSFNDRCRTSDGRVWKSIYVGTHQGYSPPNVTYWERTGILMTGDIDGVPTIAVDGNLVVDGTILANAIQAAAIKANHMDTNELFVGLTIQSTNYIAGVSGWKLDSGGNLEMNGGTLTVTGGLDFDDVSGTTKPADNADVTDYTKTSTIALVNGTSDTIITGNTAKRTSGGSAWDADVYSLNSFTGGAVLRFQAMTTNKHQMIGINQDPSTDHDYTSIDYCFAMRDDSSARIYESGSSIDPVGAYTTDTIFEIKYDGSNIIYSMDGVVKRTVTGVGSDLEFFIDSSMFLDAEFRILSFEPYADVTYNQQGNLIFSPSDNMITNPDFEIDMQGWEETGSSAYSIETISDGMFGGKVFEVINSATLRATKYIPIDPSKTYYGEIWIKVTAIDATHEYTRFYAGITNYDYDKVITNDDGFGGSRNSNSYFIVSNRQITSVDTEFVQYTGIITGIGADRDQFAGDVRYVKPMVLCNYQNTDGAEMQIAFMRFTEVNLDATDNSSWEHTSDTTKIDGGEIHASSQIIIGNIVDGDYCIIDGGDIEFFYWGGSVHNPYKSLKRREEGISQNGTLVYIPGYFKTEPLVDILPKSIQTYSTSLAAYSVDQILQCEAQNITEYATDQYRFTVKALLIASGTGTDTDDPSDVSGTDTRMLYWNNWTTVETLTSSSESSPAATTGISVSGSASITASSGIHRLRMTTTLVITGGDTGTESVKIASWTDDYHTGSKTISMSWSNVAFPVSSGTHTMYLRTVFEAAAWENNITCITEMTNMNMTYTFAPDAQEAAGDIKWIATGE